MLRIRFLRVGKKNRPHFRLVVAPQRSAPKTGEFLEVLGSYNPLRHEKVFKKDRIEHWIAQGAQPSDSARNMLISEGIIEGKKIPVHKKAEPKTTEEETPKPEKRAGEPAASHPDPEAEKEEAPAEEEKKPTEEAKPDTTGEEKGEGKEKPAQG